MLESSESFPKYPWNSREDLSCRPVPIAVGAQVTECSSRTLDQDVDASLRRSLTALSSQVDTSLETLLKTILCVLFCRITNATALPIGIVEASEYPVSTGFHGKKDDGYRRLSEGSFDIADDPIFLYVVQKAKLNRVISAGGRELLVKLEKGAASSVVSTALPADFNICIQLAEMAESGQMVAKFEPISSSRSIESKKIALIIISDDNKLRLRWQYDEHCFESDAIPRLATSFEEFINSVISEPHQKVSAYQLPKPYVVGNDSEGVDDLSRSKRYPMCLHELFEDQVVKTPGRVAIVEGLKCVSYQDLNCTANEFARKLVKRGVGRGDFVGIYLDRSIEFVTCLLAVIKLGACYVPLDRQLPLARLKLMIRESGMATIVTNSFGERALSRLGAEPENIQVIDLESSFFVETNPAVDSENLSVSISENAPVSLLFTSGTTGSPKGVVCTHKGMVNRVNWMKKSYPVLDDDVYLHRTAPGFIDHIAEIFEPLSSGVRLVVAKESGCKDVLKLVDIIGHYKISRIALVPSVLGKLLSARKLRKLETLRVIVSSGETLPCKLVSSVGRNLPNVSLLNLYGSTEISADVSCYEATIAGGNGLLSYFSYGDKYPEGERDNESRLAPFSIEDKITFPDANIEDLKKEFVSTGIPANGMVIDEYMGLISRNVIPYSVNVSSPHYIGHMTSVLPNYLPELNKYIAQLNQNVVKVETSKSLTLVERQVLGMMHRLFYGYSDQYYNNHTQDPAYMFGVVSSGGTTANITAMWCARALALIGQGVSREYLTKKGVNKILWDLGYKDTVIIGTRLLHYSFRKCASLMGIGEESILIIDQDENQRICLRSLNETIARCKKEKKLILAIVGIAGSTETGIIDPLNDLSEIADEYGMHFHVDAAWGGALMFSDRYRDKLKGIEKADSITFCPHKQLYTTQGMSLCLFREPKSLSSIATHANYQAQSGSYDLGQYTLEGSRSAISLLLHASLHLLAKSGYTWLIDQSMSKTDYFVELINRSEYFELVCEPDMNIVNYRYLPAELRSRHGRDYSDEENAYMDNAVETIQQQQFSKGDTFVSKTKILNRSYSSEPISVFRVVISNPLTTEKHLREVLDDQLELASLYVENGEEPVRYFEKDSRSTSHKGYERSKLLSAPVGRAISNNKVYILGPDLKPVKGTDVGEICVAGKGLSIGYHGQPAMTAERFIPNPMGDAGYSRLYCTGDKAHWLPEGDIRYIGRKDSQIKIEGNRIELEEIELELQSIETCQAVAVCSYVDSEDRCTIVAYVVPVRDELMTNTDWPEQLKEELKLSLADYMVPHKIQPVKNLPYTPGGKLDRKKLFYTSFVAPANQENSWL